MSKEQLHGLMHDALRASDADQTEIVTMTSNSALTWYAENIIHQNVAEHTARVQVRAVVGKKVGSASTTDCSPEGLTLVVQQASQAARLMPDDPGFQVFRLLNRQLQKASVDGSRRPPPPSPENAFLR